MATTVCMFFMGKLLTTVFARALITPNSFLVPAILISSLIGVYSTKGHFFDIWLALGLGSIAYVLRRLDYSVAAFVLAMVLSPIIEKSFRRSLVLSEGDYAIFFERVYSQVILLFIVATISYAIWKTIKTARAKTVSAEASS